MRFLAGVGALAGATLFPFGPSSLTVWAVSLGVWVI